MKSKFECAFVKFDNIMSNILENFCVQCYCKQKLHFHDILFDMHPGGTRLWISQCQKFSMNARGKHLEARFFRYTQRFLRFSEVNCFQTHKVTTELRFLSSDPKESKCLKGYSRMNYEFFRKVP